MTYGQAAENAVSQLVKKRHCFFPVIPIIIKALKQITKGAAGITGSFFAPVWPGGIRTEWRKLW